MFFLDTLARNGTDGVGAAAADAEIALVYRARENSIDGGGRTDGRSIRLEIHLQRLSDTDIHGLQLPRKHVGREPREARAEKYLTMLPAEEAL